MYGLNEKQMKKTFKNATKLPGVIGENFLFLLESRLDNIIYRAGIANTRRQSRQFVNHGHIMVNNKKVDIPSYVLKPGDKFQIKKSFKDNFFVNDNLEKTKTSAFVDFDKKSLKGEFLRLPSRDEISGEINESLIVEYYNK